MDNNNHFFLYGGIFAFFFSFTLLTAIYITMVMPSRPTYFSIADDAIISISMQDLDEKATQKYLADLSKTVTKEGDSDIEKIQDADALFDDVKTESIVYSKETKEDETKKIDPDFLKKLQVRTKVVPSDTGSTITQRLNIKDAEQSLKNLEMKKAKSGEKDEYYAKVHDILYAQWHPTASKELAIVKVKISSTGRFSYQVKQWSANETFNKELQSHLEYLKERSFPIPPSGSSVTLDVNFISKEDV